MDHPPEKMTETEIKTQIALAQPGKTVTITFEPHAGITELQALATLSTEDRILMDNSIPPKHKDDTWRFWHNRQRRFVARFGFSWKRFHDMLDSDKITHVEAR